LLADIGGFPAELCPEVIKGRPREAAIRFWETLQGRGPHWGSNQSVAGDFAVQLRPRETVRPARAGSNSGLAAPVSVLLTLSAPKKPAPKPYATDPKQGWNAGSNYLVLARHGCTQPPSNTLPMPEAR